MTTVSETLRAIERRAERALVQELRLMTQEILAMRTHLSLEDRAHADALLLKLDHLQRCQQIDAAVDDGERLPDKQQHQPDTFMTPRPTACLVHFYGQGCGNLERVVLAATFAHAVQVMREHLGRLECQIVKVDRATPEGTLDVIDTDDRVLATIQPCEPVAPDIHHAVSAACAAFEHGDRTALLGLFVRELSMA